MIRHYTTGNHPEQLALLTVGDVLRTRAKRKADRQIQVATRHGISLPGSQAWLFLALHFEAPDCATVKRREGCTKAPHMHADDIPLGTLNRLRCNRNQKIKYYISMAGSSRTTFTKRQKERARLDKRAEKEQRKAQRKQSGDAGAVPTQPVADLVVTHDEDGQPQGFDFHDFAK